MPVRDFLALIERDPPHRVEGKAVYLASEAGGMPRALLNNLKFNRVLHQRNVLLTFVRPEVPFVSAENRVEIQNLGEGLCRIIARYGFMESPNVVSALRAAEEAGVPYEPEADRICRRPRESDLRRRLGHAAVAQAPVRIHGP